MFMLRNFGYKNFKNAEKCVSLVQQVKSDFRSEAITSCENSLNPHARQFCASSSKLAEAIVDKNNKKRLISGLNESYGQPTPATHPHLINNNDLVPGIKREEFVERRQRLLTFIKKHMADNRQLDAFANRNHLVIIPSAGKKYMSDKIPYVFRQNSNFYYLCGCLEPDTVLALYIDTNSKITSILFMRPKDKHAELWDGARTGVDNALEMFGVEESYAIDTFEEKLTNISNMEKPLIWYDANNSDLQNITQSLHQIAGTVNNLHNPTSFIHALRLYKSVAEQNLMRKTCEIASNAINEVMCESRPGHSEHHLFAMVDYKCRMNNASYLAYPPVVASGNNATTIHYISNTQLTKSGDLVLMDAGCEYGGYTSDITRTWPISGEFSQPQKVLYDIVLLLQKDLIENHLLKEGGETLDKLFDTMCIKLGKCLQEAGLVKKDISTEQDYARAGYKFCPHHVSHYLGMDVHDTPLMPRTLNLLPGMVCTVEPGIYIPSDCQDVPPEFRGMGVRIEDDILIASEKDIEVLTKKCLKERRDLENAFKEKTSQKQ